MRAHRTKFRGLEASSDSFTIDIDGQSSLRFAKDGRCRIPCVDAAAPNRPSRRGVDAACQLNQKV
jgi:hypothetical protein